MHSNLKKKINDNSIVFIYYNIIDLFDCYNITNYIDNNKLIISDHLYEFFLNINNPEKLNNNVNNIKEVIKKYAKVKIINDNSELSNFYKEKDIQLYFDNFCKNITESRKLLSKDDLFLKFKNSIISNVKIQDSKYIFNESIMNNDIEIKFVDIKDKLYELLYNTDISKYVDMYVCNNTCECTQQKLCNLRNEILIILYSTLSYKSTNIIILDTEIMNNTIVDDTEIYNKIHNFLTSKTFDVYTKKTFPQIYLPS